MCWEGEAAHPTPRWDRAKQRFGVHARGLGAWSHWGSLRDFIGECPHSLIEWREVSVRSVCMVSYREEPGVRMSDRYLEALGTYVLASLCLGS